MVQSQQATTLYGTVTKPTALYGTVTTAHSTYGTITTAHRTRILKIIQKYLNVLKWH